MPHEVPEFDAPSTYDEAASDYERASERYWAFLGARTVHRLDLRRGDHVLDVPCGPGSSALPAASAVGPGGSVVAVDLAPRMLELARAKATAAGLDNLRLVLGDMARIDLPSERFDAVICVLGIFFMPDMVAQARELWRLVRPGGRLAVTVFEHAFFSPMYEVWKDAVEKERGERVIGPWERTNDRGTLARILGDAGIEGVRIDVENERIALPAPEAWWDIVMGTGMRKWVTELDPAAAERVRAHDLRWAAEHAVGSLTVGGMYATATKPPV